jgi:hypothetical protein
MKIKNKLFGAVLAICMCNSIQAATTIGAFNYTTGTAGARQVLTSAVDSTPFVGTYRIGTFSTPLGIGSVASGSFALANFGWTEFGSAAFNTSTNQRGLFGTTTVTATLPNTGEPNGPFIGNNIYVVVLNAAGNDAIIWRSTSLFANETAGIGGPTVSINAMTTPLERGILLPDAVNGLLAGNAISNGVGSTAVTFGPIAAIPETSTSLLGAIAALALLRRRRN